MTANSIVNHTITIREELENLMDVYEPGWPDEMIADACISASEFLLWAAEMAATGKGADGTMNRNALIRAARQKIDEAERLMSSAQAAHSRPIVAFQQVAAE